MPTLPVYNVEIFDSKFVCSSSWPYSYILPCNSMATLRRCERQHDAVFHHTPSTPSYNIFPSYRNNCCVCSFINIYRIRYKKTANVAMRDVVRKLYRGVLYFQHVTVLHVTRVNVTLCVLPKIKAFSSQLFTKFTKSQHGGIYIYIYIYMRPSDEFSTNYVANLWLEDGQRWSKLWCHWAYFHENHTCPATMCKIALYGISWKCDRWISLKWVHTVVTKIK